MRNIHSIEKIAGFYLSFVHSIGFWAILKKDALSVTANNGFRWSLWGRIQCCVVDLERKENRVDLSILETIPLWVGKTLKI